MGALQAALWGLLGGFCTEGLQLWQAVQRARGKWPPEKRNPAFAVAEIIRLTAGAGVAAAFGSSGQVTGALGAFTFGVAAPLIVEQLTKTIPLTPAPVGNPAAVSLPEDALPRRVQSPDASSFEPGLAGHPRRQLDAEQDG